MLISHYAVTHAATCFCRYCWLAIVSLCCWAFSTLFSFPSFSSIFKLQVVYLKQHLIGLWSRAPITFVVKTWCEAILHFGNCQEQRCICLLFTQLECTLTFLDSSHWIIVFALLILLWFNFFFRMCVYICMRKQFRQTDQRRLFQWLAIVTTFD